jgi:phosphoenolpyruvate---glycerone phosphotransferase subunit DhaL
VSSFSVVDLQKALGGMIARTREREEELNTLDAELGDGDLGSTLVSVGAAVGRALGSLPDDVSAALSHLALVIGEVSGSSFSGLLMVGLSKAGVALSGKISVSADDVSRAWRAALAAMAAASGARPGDKTMLDVVAAIVDAPREANLVDEVSRALQFFRAKPCRAGRARVAGDRSIGRDDPGMIAMLRLVEGATGQRATC